MMITGIDYIIYSDKSPYDIEEYFISLLKKKWNKLIIDEFERTDSRLELFFAKDKKMFYRFDKVAYTLNEQGEGCFMLLSNIIDQLESKIKILDIIYPESKHNKIQYDSTIMLHNICEYTLVLPAEITESDFAREIYTYLENALRLR